MDDKLELSDNCVIPEVLFKETIDLMNVGIAIVRGFEVLYVNDAFLRFSGFEREDVPTMTVLTVIPPESMDFIVDRVQRRIAGDPTLPHSYEDIALLSKSGKRFTCDIYPSLIQYDGAPASIYVCVETTKHRKTEKTLHEFFEYCPLPVFIKDKNDRVVMASHHLEKITGKSQLDVIGKTTPELFDDKDFIEQIRKEDEYVFSTHKPLIVEEEVKGRIYEKIKFPINGDLLGSFSMDITDRVLATKALQKSEEQYKLLAEHMQDTVWLTDMKFKIVYCSPSLFQKRGYTFEELQALPLDQNFTPASFELLMRDTADELDKIYNDPTYQMCRIHDLEYKCKDGSTTWAESKFSLIRDKDGKPQYILGEGRNIDERKHAEEKYKNLYNILAATLDNRSDMIWVYDKDKDLMFSNKALRESPYNLDVFAVNECTILPTTDERFIQRKLDVNGDEIVLEILKQPIFDKDGNIIGCSGSVQDITEQMLTQDKLMKKIEKLEITSAHLKDKLSLSSASIFMENNNGR